MKRQNSITEDRLIEWALVYDDKRRGTPPHDPSRPDESIEYRIMKGDIAPPAKGAIKSDGGLYQAYRKYRHEIAVVQRFNEINKIVERMRRIKPAHYPVITQAFLDKPGTICDSRIGANEKKMSQNKYLRLYGEAIMWVDGALDKMVA